jgi:carbamate kinase
LTAVDKVYVNYNQSNQRALDSVTVKELEKYINEGQFAKGSMLPKVEAAKKFVEFASKKQAVIANLSQTDQIFSGAGTKIIFT